MTTAAKTISLVISPEVVVVVGTLTLALRRSVVDVLPAVVFCGLVALFTGAYRTYGWWRVRNFSVLPREYRLNLYISALLGTGLAAIVFGSQIVPNLFWMNIAMVFSCYIALFILVNSYIDKASQHVGMLTVWIFMLIETNSVLFGVLLCALPAVMWSRLVLKRHTWPQLWWGFAIGGVAGLLAWLVL